MYRPRSVRPSQVPCPWEGHPRGPDGVGAAITRRRQPPCAHQCVHGTAARVDGVIACHTQPPLTPPHACGLGLCSPKPACSIHTHLTVNFNTTLVGGYTALSCVRVCACVWDAGRCVPRVTGRLLPLSACTSFLYMPLSRHALWLVMTTLVPVPPRLVTCDRHACARAATPCDL